MANTYEGNGPTAPNLNPPAPNGNPNNPRPLMPPIPWGQPPAGGNGASPTGGPQFYGPPPSMPPNNGSNGLVSNVRPPVPGFYGPPPQAPRPPGGSDGSTPYGPPQRRQPTAKGFQPNNFPAAQGQPGPQFYGPPQQQPPIRKNLRVGQVLGNKATGE